MRGVTGNIERGFEPESLSHRRYARIDNGRCVVACRPHEQFLGARGGEAQGMANGAAGDFLAARQAGQDRQAGCVSGGPSGRAQRVRAQVEDRPGTGPPGAGFLAGIPGFVKEAMVRIHDQEMVVAAMFEHGIGRNGIGTGVAFVGVIEGHRYFRLSVGYRVIGNADGTAVPGTGAKVRMQAGEGSDGVDVVPRTGVHRRPVDSDIPDIVGRKERTFARRHARHHKQGHEEWMKKSVIFVHLVDSSTVIFGICRACGLSPPSSRQRRRGIGQRLKPRQPHRIALAVTQ